MKKTIVYLTVNIKNFKIYVGVHDVEDPFTFDHYYGDGISKKNGIPKHPKTPFARAIKKYGFDSFIRFTLKVCDTRKQALDIEELIVNEEFINRPDTYNVALGGGNPPIKYREIYQYNFDGNFIQKYKSIRDASSCIGIAECAISRAAIDKTTSGGYLWSHEYFDKLDISEYKITQQNVHLYVYLASGEFYKEYDRIMDFAREQDVNLGPIQRAVKAQTKINGYYVSFDKKPKFVKDKKKITKGKPVYQYTLSGDFIKKFDSVSAVVKELGNTYRQIPSSIRLNGTCGGFQWSWDRVNCLSNKVTNVYRSRKIGQYTLTGELVRVYKSQRECRREFGNVAKVLNGQAKSAKGFTFKYLE